jgi:RNA polymerase-binding transcription factor DksA
MKTNKKKVQKNVRPSFGQNIIAFPGKLVTPIGRFLSENLKKLEVRKKEIAKEDPFRDSSRLLDNASPDADAEEQFGHARTVALKEQLERKIVQTKRALRRLNEGKYGICEDCGKMIDTDRLKIYPEATLCAKCQALREK